MASTQGDFSGLSQDMNLSDSINIIDQVDEYHETVETLGDTPVGGTTGRPVRGATGGIPRSFSNGNSSERRFVDTAELLCREAAQDVTLADAYLKDNNPRISDSVRMRATLEIWEHRLEKAAEQYWDYNGSVRDVHAWVKHIEDTIQQVTSYRIACGENARILESRGNQIGGRIQCKDDKKQHHRHFQHLMVWGTMKYGKIIGANWQ